MYVLWHRVFKEYMSDTDDAVLLFESEHDARLVADGLDVRSVTDIRRLPDDFDGKTFVVPRRLIRFCEQFRGG